MIGSISQLSFHVLRAIIEQWTAKGSSNEQRLMRSEITQLFLCVEGLLRNR